MSTLLIANNCTRESGSFMGDQLCALKTAYLFVEAVPAEGRRVIMSASPFNEMHFLWTKFVETYGVELVYDNWNPGDWNSRWQAWDEWRATKRVKGRPSATWPVAGVADAEVELPFDIYRELYLRIHGGVRQRALCGSERGLGRRNIYSYWFCGQEGCPDEPPPGADWFDDTLTHHPAHDPVRDVYISPHAKTQGNVTFTFEFWAEVVHRLIDAGVSVTVGFDGYFCEDLIHHQLYRKFWGTHQEWMQEVCRHRLVSCGNTGTGWLAAACGVPMITMEPPNSQMPDHRYRECGLKNIVEVVDRPDAAYVAGRIAEQVKQRLVLTTGCYDVLHAGHVRHLERARALGSRLVVALNSDESVRKLKGPTRPVNPQGQRRAVLEALRCVDEVRVFDGADAVPLIRELRPQVLACGFGYAEQDIVGRGLVEGWGGRAVVTCKADASNDPRGVSSTKVVERVRAADLIEVCRVAAPYSVNPFEKLQLLGQELLSVAHLPGDLADLGTMNGGSALVLQRLAPGRRLHLFDTWAGNPYDDPLCHHKLGEWAASYADCRRLLGDGELVHYHRGTFPLDCASDPGCPLRPDSQFCFVYVDMDTYQATRDALYQFWPLVVEGGKVVLDDYGWEPCAGVRVAVDEFFAAAGDCYRRTAGYTCIVEKR